MTAYAIFKIDKGVIKAEKSDDIYTLDNSIPSSARPTAPAPILKIAWAARNASPMR